MKTTKEHKQVYLETHYLCDICGNKDKDEEQSRNRFNYDECGFCGKDYCRDECGSNLYDHVYNKLKGEEKNMKALSDLSQIVCSILTTGINIHKSVCNECWNHINKDAFLNTVENMKLQYDRYEQSLNAIKTHLIMHEDLPIDIR